MNIVNHWLESGLPALIRGVRLAPKGTPKNKKLPFSEEGEQGTAYHLVQPSNNREWILKKFHTPALPDHTYLIAIRSLVPRGISFKAATKRVILGPDDLKWGEGIYSSTEFGKWINETILMPKMPGILWKDAAQQIRKGTLEIPMEKRVLFAKSLAEAVRAMEDNGCSHRDISNENLLLDIQEYVAYLVDWDSLFHGSLYFLKNMPAGTEGYMGKWISDKSGQWDARKSWNRAADRFPLAILIAELLLMDRKSPSFHQGTLFSQEILSNYRHASIVKTIESLHQISDSLGELFKQAVTASSYDECPSPINWQEALDGELILEPEREEEPLEIVMPQEPEEEQEKKTKKETKGKKAKKEEIAELFEEDGEQYEELTSAPFSEPPKPNYWLLLLVFGLPLLVWIVSQVHERKYRSFHGFGPVKIPVPTTEVKLADDKQSSDGKPVASRSYLVEILYADCDLKMHIDGQSILLNKENIAQVSIKPGIYTVSLTFTGLVFDQDGAEIKRTDPVTYSRKIQLDQEEKITIRINREEKQWQILDTQ